MKIIDWKQVIATHQTIAGINCTGRIVNSLLCNAGAKQQYPNRIEGGYIYYFVNSRTQTAGYKALVKSIEQKNIFPVFEKLGVDRWRKIGTYSVLSFKKTDAESTEFTLKKIK